MTYKELALLRYVLEEVKDGKKPFVEISNDQKVDLDSMHNYFNNILLDVKKQKKRGGVRKGGNIAYQLRIEVNK